MARKLGAKSKYPAFAKENIQCVFTRLGGTAAMAKWAKANPTDFYKLYARLIPAESNHDNGVVSIKILKFGDEEIKLPKFENKKLEVLEVKRLEHNASE